MWSKLSIINKGSTQNTSSIKLVTKENMDSFFYKHNTQLSVDRKPYVLLLINYYHCKHDTKGKPIVHTITYQKAPARLKQHRTGKSSQQI